MRNVKKGLCLKPSCPQNLNFQGSPKDLIRSVAGQKNTAIIFFFCSHRNIDNAVEVEKQPLNFYSESNDPAILFYFYAIDCKNNNVLQCIMLYA